LPVSGGHAKRSDRSDPTRARSPIFANVRSNTRVRRGGGVGLNQWRVWGEMPSCLRMERRRGSYFMSGPVGQRILVAALGGKLPLVAHFLPADERIFPHRGSAAPASAVPPMLSRMNIRPPTGSAMTNYATQEARNELTHVTAWLLWEHPSECRVAERLNSTLLSNRRMSALVESWHSPASLREWLTTSINSNGR